MSIVVIEEKQDCQILRREKYCHAAGKWDGNGNPFPGGDSIILWDLMGFLADKINEVINNQSIINQ